MSAAVILGQATVGAFFALSGYNKLTNAQRHAALVAELQADHVPMVNINQWFVPAVELTAGSALAVGFMPQWADALLMCIIAVAICTAGPRTVASYKPINRADWLDDWLYLPETLYMVILLMLQCLMG